MILTARDIRKGKMIDPLDPEALQPAGYDAHIGQISRPRIAGNLELQPRVRCCISTKEWFKIPTNILGLVFGKSSYARKGLIINTTPLDPGWEGNITISLHNNGTMPITLRPGAPICQVIFLKLTSQTFPYRGKYQKSKGVKL